MSETVGISCLVLDDDFVVRAHVIDQLRDLGIDRTASCATVDDALERLALSRPDFAIIDYRLGGSETCVRFAAELGRQNVPFVVTTGLGEIPDAPRALSDAPIVEKPLSLETLRNHLREFGLGPEP